MGKIGSPSRRRNSHITPDQHLTIALLHEIEQLDAGLAVAIDSATNDVMRANSGLCERAVGAALATQRTAVPTTAMHGTTSSAGKPAQGPDASKLRALRNSIAAIQADAEGQVRDQLTPEFWRSCSFGTAGSKRLPISVEAVLLAALGVLDVPLNAARVPFDRSPDSPVALAAVASNADALQSVGLVHWSIVTINAKTALLMASRDSANSNNWGRTSSKPSTRVSTRLV